MKTAPKEEIKLADTSSIEKLDEYVRSNPKDPAGYIDLAKAHHDAGNTTRGIEVLDRLIKNSEGEGGALLLRAELLAKHHDWIGAYRDIRESARLGAKVPLKFRLKVFYMQWLLLANEGWRPEALSRYMTLALCLILGILMLYMSFGVLGDGGPAGGILVFVMGIGFIWAGLAVGGVSKWLKTLQDRLSPGWDTPVQKIKSKGGSKKSKR